MKQRAWRETNAVAGEWGDANSAATWCKHKVLEIQDTAVYSNAVNNAMSHGSEV